MGTTAVAPAITPEFWLVLVVAADSHDLGLFATEAEAKAELREHLAAVGAPEVDIEKGSVDTADGVVWFDIMPGNVGHWSFSRVALRRFLEP